MKEQERDIILAIDVVEPGLVNAVKLLSKELGRPLKGVMLVHKGFIDYPNRPIDTTGLFEEIVVDYDNPDELQKTIKPFVERILVVTTRYEDAIHHFSQLVPFIPYVNTPTESSLVWATEKPLMRDRLNAYDEKLVPKYQYMVEKDLPRLKELTRDFSYPVIVKPGSLWSSFLVTRCNNEAELEECLKNTFKIIKDIYDRVLRVTQPSVLVEEMMQGDMYSTDVYISQDGEMHCLPLVKVITAASVGLPGYHGHRYILPTGLSQEETDKAFEAARASVKALNLRSITAHVEMFHTKQGWKIIELGGRIGGYRESLYREVYAIEHCYNDLAVRADLQPKVTDKAIRHARVETMYAEQEGVIETIEGLEEARKLDSAVFVEKHAKPGDTALFANNGGDLLVDAMLSNNDVAKLEKDVEEFRKLVKIKIKK
jgi:D-alanine-D-alanine ligase-like ATP-grasp enzyme